ILSNRTAQGLPGSGAFSPFTTPRGGFMEETPCLPDVRARVRAARERLAAMLAEKNVPEGPVAAYLPTQHELAVLAGHWGKQVLDIEERWRTSGTLGAAENRWHRYALDRLGQIAELVGEEAVRTEFDKLSPPPVIGAAIRATIAETG